MLNAALACAAEAHKSQTRDSGLPYIIHPVTVAILVADVLEDPEAIAAALLHDTLEDTPITPEEIVSCSTATVLRLVRALTKIQHLPAVQPSEREAEHWRRLILGMAEDLRVIIVKLADRVHNMRTVDVLSQERQIRIATETRVVYAPLADRFGLQLWKAELEDLAFKSLDRSGYQSLAQALMLRKSERQDLLDAAVADIRTELESNQVAPLDVAARAKHLWSIQRKLVDRVVSVDGLHDLHGVRVVLDDVGQCYQALGIIHHRWQAVPGRMKDYISHPKSNGYQSLHTTVIGPGGGQIEIQLRTREQHRIAEWGLAAHWSYKEARLSATSNEWFSHLQDLATDQAGADEFLEYLQKTLQGGELFALTPTGDVKRLPARSTVLDFAFAVHTDVGLHMSGARVNGRQVSLQGLLQTGDTVEIQTHPRAHPTRDWLSWTHLPRARQKIRQYLAHYDPLVKATASDTVSTSTSSKGKALPSIVSVSDSIAEESTMILPLGPSQPLSKTATSDTTGMLVKMASCCWPIPGESICGYTTRGRGVSIHRSNCPELLTIPVDRQMDISWETLGHITGTARLWIHGSDRHGWAMDLMQAVTSQNASMAGVQITVKREAARARLDVQVQSLHHLNKVLTSLEQVRNVTTVVRETTAGSISRTNISSTSSLSPKAPTRRRAVRTLEKKRRPPNEGKLK